MLLLAEGDTWSKACWVGIFQHCYYSEYNVWHPAMRSISSSESLLPTSVRASHRPLQRLWHCSSTDGRTLQVHIPQLSECWEWGGLKKGGREVFHSQKNIYHCRRRWDQTNQQRLENMISPEEECECWGTLQGWCTLHSCARRTARWAQRGQI